MKTNQGLLCYQNVYLPDGFSQEGK